MEGGGEWWTDKGGKGSGGLMEGGGVGWKVMEGEGGGGEWGGGMGMVGTDVGGMEGRDWWRGREWWCWALSPFIVILCCLIMCHCHLLDIVCVMSSHIVFTSSHLLAMLLSLSYVIVIRLLSSHPVSQQGGLGGRWDGGYLVPRVNNDEWWMSFIVLVARSLLATWHLHFPLAVGGHIHLWVVVFICKGHFHL